MNIYWQGQTQTQVVINCLMLLHPSAQQDAANPGFGIPGYTRFSSYNSLTTQVYGGLLQAAFALKIV